MAITTDILGSYRAPRAMLRKQLAAGVREDRALVVLYVGCLLVFVSSLPGLARDAFLDPSVPLDARIGGALLAWMFVVPLFSYVLAGASHLVARVFGGKGSWYSSRLALFWAMLVVSPLWLFYGLVDGLIGQGPIVGIVGGVSLITFVVLWLLCLFEAETAPAS